MSEYRVRSSGELKNQGEIRKLHPNTSIPKIWGSNVCDDLGIDPVLGSPPPTPSGPYKTVVRNGAVEDGDNWVEAWAEKNMFSKHTDGDGVVHTKAEQETAYQANLDAQVALSVRTTRNVKLADSDWHGFTDNEMSEEMTTYRQALRDVPQQEGFPNEIDWPDEPS